MADTKKPEAIIVLRPANAAKQGCGCGCGCGEEK